MATRIVGALLLLAVALGAQAEEVTLDPVPQKVLLQYLAGNGDFTLIDARSPDEYAAGHVYGALNVPHDAELTDAALPEDRDRPLLLYCKSGVRALRLQNRLSELGYSEVRVLPPGQLLWSEQLPVFDCGATEPAPQVVELTTVERGDQ